VGKGGAPLRGSFSTPVRILGGAPSQGRPVPALAICVVCHKAPAAAPGVPTKFTPTRLASGPVFCAGGQLQNVFLLIREGPRENYSSAKGSGAADEKHATCIHIRSTHGITPRGVALSGFLI